MSLTNKQWLGLPLNLVWGYIAIAIFMTGDGFELAFLSHYIKALGFTPAEASFAFTLYGLAAALSAWVSGVVAEIITPQKTMFIGFVLWCIFHVLFLVFGLGQANYALILLFYGIRGLAYPLFLYAFIVAVVHNVRSDSTSAALGWFWAVYSIGIGVFGSYIPSFTIPVIGEMGTLWLALGFTPAEASFAFTLYGLAAALSAWVSGVVAEIITPQKTMFIGFVLWCIFHVLFLVFGLGQANYALILLFYGIRGLAYPLFLYAFIVAVVHNVRSDSTSAALGWFWAVYSIGIGVFGSYIPSFTIPVIGEMGTLWLALGFCVTGGILALVSMRKVQTPHHMQNLTTKEKFSELGRAVTLLYTNRNILLSSIVRIINTLSLFGFAVIMPMMFVDELGFTTSEWLQVWAVFFFTTIFTNIFWGVLAEKIGWMKVVRWFGCVGMALSSLAFYYMPQYFGHNYWMAMVPAVALGIFVAAFVPMAAVFPALEPKHKGAAISVYNLSAGLSNFLAPAIAVVLLPYFSAIGVVIAYTTLYIIAFIICPFIRVEQPGFSTQKLRAGEAATVS